MLDENQKYLVSALVATMASNIVLGLWMEARLKNAGYPKGDFRTLGMRYRRVFPSSRLGLCHLICSGTLLCLLVLLLIERLAR